MKIKNCAEQGIKWELWVAEQLRERGYNAAHIPLVDQRWKRGADGRLYGWKCDVVINDILRIEVKSNENIRWYERRDGSPVAFVQFRHCYRPDFLIGVLVTGEIPLAFVIPGSVVGHGLSFLWPQTDKSKRDMTPYLNAWHLIDAELSRR